MSKRPHLHSYVALLASMAFLSSCAETVDDISRLAGNKLKKTDLEGTWYYLQTVIDVPPTSTFSVTGETSRNEKIRWSIQEKYLVGYRAYPLVPGSEAPLENGDLFYDKDYTENPVVAYPILSHYDIGRSYNSATGEQTNVIEENTYDRPWYEREYIHVDWSQNLITNFDFVSTPMAWNEEGPAGPVITPIAYFVPEEIGGEDAWRRETEEDGSLKYFDFVGKLFVEPDPTGCLYYWMNYGTGDCTNAEVKIRSSFAKVVDDEAYESYQYDDVMMSKFGFFRSERTTYDQKQGYTDSGRRLMINRHNIWEASFEKDNNGNYKRDENGMKIPIPLKDRKVKTVPYYISEEFPRDPNMLAAAWDVMNQWNDAAVASVATIQGKDVSEYARTPIFVCCHNPVENGDDPACGQIGFSPRFGDLRYSSIHWVNADQPEGPLGYGPSITDPVTGETIAGKAHIYGASLDTYATYFLDIIRMANDDIDPDEFISGAYFNRDVLDRLYSHTDPERLHPDLKNIELDAERQNLKAHVRNAGQSAPGAKQRLERQQKRMQSKIEGYTPYSPTAANARYEDLMNKGFVGRHVNTAVQDALKSAGLSATTDDVAKRISPAWVHKQRAALKTAIEHNILLPEFFETSADGIARQYLGRTDYDNIWNELRIELFKATTLHEVGHTMGLRHNFQGSYDSLNYFPNYWDLRKETLPQKGATLTYADLFKQSSLTEDQIDGRMRDYQYSSIMDYGYSAQSDLMGLGSYDKAAFAFGYGSGYEEVSGDDPRCDQNGAVHVSGKCLVQRPGPVEIFAKNRGELGEAGKLLTRSETRFGHTVRYDDTDIPNINILERYHYSTIANAFPSLDDLQDRKWMRYDDYLANAPKDALSDEQPVRVPYAFCSDEWDEQMLSCRVFDQGADPYELVQTQVNHWRAFYYFDNFRRDRFGWWDGSVLYNTFFRNFLPLADYHQFWWFSENGFDNMFDASFERAAYTAFNLLIEALQTPPYGEYCRSRTDGTLLPLSEDPNQNDHRGAAIDDHYKVKAYCMPGEDRIQVLQGDGRRRLSRYAMDTGYYSFERPFEAGHWWTTMAAVWALTEPDASVIGVDADAGTYAIGFYNMFPEEINKIAAGILMDDPSLLAPNYKITGDRDQNGVLDGELRFVPPVALWYCKENNGELGFDGMCDWAKINPETGEEIEAQADASLKLPLYSTCSQDEDCLGFDGSNDAPKCLNHTTTKKVCTISCGGWRTCNNDCSQWMKACNDSPDDCAPRPSFCNAEGACTMDSPCGDGESCNRNGACIPSGGLNAPACSAENPFGACDDAYKVCHNGKCEYDTVLVQTDPTLYLVDDILFWGLLETSAGGDLNYQNSIRVFRMGTDEEETADNKDFEVVSFTDPQDGQMYGAISDRCGVDTFEGGHIGQCGSCNKNSDCTGYLGEFYGSFFCDMILEGEGGRCLQDCGGGLESICSEGYTCTGLADEHGDIVVHYCLPVTSTEEAVCLGYDHACDANHPHGDCPEGQGCVNGVCVDPIEKSPLCVERQPSIGTRLVKAAQSYSKDYKDALNAYNEGMMDEGGTDTACEEGQTQTCSCDGHNWVRYCENGKFGACACEEFRYWDLMGKRWKFDALMTNINFLRAYHAYFKNVY